MSTVAGSDANASWDTGPPTPWPPSKYNVGHNTTSGPRLPASEPVAGEDIPEWIGPYRVIGKLAGGGMGIVLQAWQEEPVRRIVAIKLIKLGMATLSVVERFRMEQHALALMNHQNVARVYEAGSTESGRPYFVMEYVPGEPIVNYCNAFHLDVTHRLRLFQQACDAIQHAHYKGIIHRDLKSSNILVMLQDNQPTVKVIDFGIACASNADQLFTEIGQIIGTPAYMSPEQACLGSSGVDMRSDIYSLGVVLYELLTGATPFDHRAFRSAGYAEICRMLREAEPIMPSRRLAADRTLPTPTCSQIDRAELRRRLKGDLDCIVMKAIEKDRTRRYASAAELSADVGRYLRSEPVIAGRAGFGYRGRRFVRRHPIGVVVSACIVLTLLGALVVTTWAALRATNAEHQLAAAHVKAVADKEEAVRQRAEAERERASADEARAAAEEVNRFLNDMITAVRRGQGGPEVTVREVLEKASRSMTGRFENRPLVQAALCHSIGRAYSALQRPADAVAHLREALAIRQRVLGPNAPETLWTENNLANVELRLGRSRETEHMLTSVTERRRRELGPDHPSTLASESQLAMLYEKTGQWEQALPLLGKLAAAHATTTDPGTKRPGQAALCAARHAICLAHLRRHVEAEPLLLRALDMMDAAKRDPNDDYVKQAMTALAECYRATGRDADAEVWAARLAGAVQSATRPSSQPAARRPQ